MIRLTDEQKEIAAYIRRFPKVVDYLSYYRFKDSSGFMRPNDRVCAAAKDLALNYETMTRREFIEKHTGWVVKRDLSRVFMLFNEVARGMQLLKDNGYDLEKTELHFGYSAYMEGEQIPCHIHTSDSGNSYTVYAFRKDFTEEGWNRLYDLSNESFVKICRCKRIYGLHVANTATVITFESGGQRVNATCLYPDEYESKVEGLCIRGHFGDTNDTEAGFEGDYHFLIKRDWQLPDFQEMTPDRKIKVYSKDDSLAVLDNESLRFYGERLLCGARPGFAFSFCF